MNLATKKKAVKAKKAAKAAALVRTHRDLLHAAADQAWARLNVMKVTDFCRSARSNRTVEACFASFIRRIP